MAVKIRDSDPGFKKLRRRIRPGSNEEARVGMFSAKQDTTQVIKAGVHEFGSEDGTIPERSFLRAGVDENTDKLRNFVDKNRIKLITGEVSFERFLRLFGALGEKIVKQKILDGPFTPLKQATIDRKGSSRPLIDKGRMRKGISSVIERRKSV